MAFVYLIFIGDNLQTFLKRLGKCDLLFFNDSCKIIRKKRTGQQKYVTYQQVKSI